MAPSFNTKSLPISRWTSEFIIVVIGVLIALSMESWWSRREDNQLATVYISDLYAESENNIANIQSLISISNLKRNALEEASRLLGMQFGPANSQALIQNLLQGSGIPVVMPIFDAVFLDLQSSGRINLISNDELRRYIIQVYSVMNAMNERRRRWDDATNSELHAYVSKKVPIGTVEQSGPGLQFFGDRMDSEALSLTARELHSSVDVADSVNAQARQLQAELDALETTLEAFRDFSSRLNQELALRAN